MTTCDSIKSTESSKPATCYTNNDNSFIDMTRHPCMRSLAHLSIRPSAHFSTKSFAVKKCQNSPKKLGRAHPTHPPIFFYFAKPQSSTHFSIIYLIIRRCVRTGAFPGAFCVPNSVALASPTLWGVQWAIH